MSDWSKKIATVLGGSLLLPFTVELGTAVLKNEPFSVERAAIFIAVLGGGSAVLVGVPSLWAAVTRRRTSPLGEPGPSTPKKIDVHPFVRYGPETEGLVDLFTERLDATDLHYLVYYARGKAVFRVDMLDDPSVSGMLGLTGAEGRRAAYERQGEDLRALVATMDADFDEIDSGRLMRVVLDVEKGALYYFVVHAESQRAVVGVTLGQHAVVDTDVEMQRLVDDVRGYLGYARPGP
ncbi:hypothetical protein [Antribacter gilvus]|uniref:hypothetical protein n=1 Tax=Antribacter gilvus TaxID=2304675 RepID=UPI000F790EEE|nr:hypothetical protein [Antribacter gilvus]